MLEGVCEERGGEMWEGQNQVSSALTLILKRLDFQLQGTGSH